MWKKNRKRGADVIENLILVVVLGGLALTVLGVIANTLSNTASTHATPIIQSVEFNKYL